MVVKSENELSCCWIKRSKATKVCQEPGRHSKVTEPRCQSAETGSSIEMMPKDLRSETVDSKPKLYFKLCFTAFPVLSAQFPGWYRMPSPNVSAQFCGIAMSQTNGRSIQTSVCRRICCRGCSRYSERKRRSLTGSIGVIQGAVYLFRLRDLSFPAYW